ncbi:ABC transporter permease [Georgenia alba]|uniref:ABC transporter permease n=1 Tax=Georgenia alba TaxID=2233858 RepID=A0ABW2QA26_9MICO
MRNLWTLTRADLRQRLRDRSVLIFALVVPLALISVLNLVFGGVEDLELEPVTVAASTPADDMLGEVLLTTYGQMDGMDVTVEQVGAREARGMVDDGEAHLAVVVPGGISADLEAGRDATVEMVEGDDAGVEVDVLQSVTRSVLDQYRAGVVAAAAGGELGLTQAELGSISEQVAAATSTMTVVEGEAPDQQLDTGAALVAGQAGLFLLFTVGFGVLGMLTERKQGTLARLWSTPVRPGLVVLSKALVSLLLGVVATGVLLGVGALLFGADFGSPLVVAVLVLCVVIAATSLMFIIVRLARTEEQANIVQSILAIGLGTAGGSFFPISASGALGTVLDLNPVAAFTRGLGISHGGGGLGDVGGPILVMLGFAVVCLLLSRVVPDRGGVL